MKKIKDLQIAKDMDKKATMHIMQDGNKYNVTNDCLSGRVVFSANTIKECEEWYFNRLIGGFTKVNY